MMIPGKRIRVAVDARSLLCRAPRGEGKSLLRLYQELARVRPDIEVVLFGDGTTPQYRGPLPPGARVVGMAPPGDRFNTWEDWFFPLRALWAGCTLMHCTSSGAPGWCPLPMVMTVHDLIPLVFDDGHTPAQRSLFRRRLARGLAKARHILAVSEHTRRDMELEFPGSAARTEVMHWGADSGERGTPLPAEEPYLLAFGGEAPRKNTLYTVDRFIGAARGLPALRLKVVGLNSERLFREVAARAAAAGLSGRIDTPGFVTDGELAAMLRGARALLYLSLYEGFGVPLLEAIAAGTPVIASDRTSIPEVLAGAPGCHSLDEPAAIEEAIVSIVTDTTLARQVAAAQGSLLPRFSWPNNATRLGVLLDAAQAGRSIEPGIGRSTC